MADERRRKRFGRRPLVYTIALVVAAASGATTVFLVGSANRRSDRAAIVAYERSVLPAVREGGRIVQQEMKPTLREMADGEVTDPQVLDRAGAWKRVFDRARDDLLRLDPPEFLGDIESGWEAAMGGYLIAVDAFMAAARADPASRQAALDRAASLGERADQLFDRVAGIIQFHRRRLGLGATPNLPDPTPSGAA